MVKGKTLDFAKLSLLKGRGVLLTAEVPKKTFKFDIQDEDKYDFISRCFFPCYGINEDPVTGSAHCALGPYWANKFNKSSLVAYQASPRGGLLYLQLMDDRVVLGGDSVVTMRTDILY